MNISLEQTITILVFTALFFVLYFGCETTPKDIQDLEKSRTANVQYLDIPTEINAANRKIATDDRLELEQHALNLQESLEDEQKIEILKTISGKWYEIGNLVLATHYAEEAALLENTAKSWAITGSTAFIAMASSKEPNARKYARQKALLGFENAISIEPERLDYKINHSLVHVEMPPEENPMKGITMLLELESNNPDSTGVHIQLGRLALQTNQMEKATQRFEKVVSLEPNNADAHCYLTEIYKNTGNVEKADYHATRCLNR